MVISSRVLVLGGIAAAFVVGGCGDRVSKREARKGWSATRSAMAGAGLSTGISVSGTFGPDGASGAVQGVVDCPEGGSMDVIADGEITAQDVEASMSVEFDGCKSDKIVVDGVLDYELVIDSDGVRASFAGELDFSGRAKGSCVVDASAEVSVSKISASFNGDICGFKWSDLR